MEKIERDINYLAYRNDLRHGNIRLGFWVAYVDGNLVGSSNDQNFMIDYLAKKYPEKPKFLTQAGNEKTVELPSILSVEYIK